MRHSGFPYLYSFPRRWFACHVCTDVQEKLTQEKLTPARWHVQFIKSFRNCLTISLGKWTYGMAMPVPDTKQYHFQESKVAPAKS